MVKGSAKKVVVIRDIPSDRIEEAILILRSGPAKPVTDESLLKEAETIINDYIKKNNLSVMHNRRLDESQQKPDGKPPLIWMVNMSLLAGIAFLLFVLIKLL